MFAYKFNDWYRFEFENDGYHLAAQYSRLVETQVHAAVGYYLSSHPDSTFVSIENVLSAFRWDPMRIIHFEDDSRLNTVLLHAESCYGDIVHTRVIMYGPIWYSDSATPESYGCCISYYENIMNPVYEFKMYILVNSICSDFVCCST